MTLSEVYFYPTPVHGTTLRLPSHRAVQWLVNPRHEEGRWRALRQYVRPDSVVYDIGAEQGDLSALLASWVDPAEGGGIVLVEPNPKAWPCIAATFAENDLAGRVLACYEGLLGSTAGTRFPVVRTAETDRPWPDASTGTIDPAAGFVDLATQADGFPTMTLDALVATVGRKPEVLNIDVEGAEYEVLRGAAETLEAWSPVVALSVHPEMLADGWDRTPGEVLGLLEDAGYRCDLVHVDHELHYICVPR